VLIQPLDASTIDAVVAGVAEGVTTGPPDSSVRRVLEAKRNWVWQNKLVDQVRYGFVGIAPTCRSTAVARKSVLSSKIRLADSFNVPTRECFPSRSRVE
jgi:hypothetical protein